MSASEFAECPPDDAAIVSAGTCRGGAVRARITRAARAASPSAACRGRAGAGWTDTASAPPGCPCGTCAHGRAQTSTG
eukprot:6134121-Prymnesium_polylepis.1